MVTSLPPVCECNLLTFPKTGSSQNLDDVVAQTSIATTCACDFSRYGVLTFIRCYGAALVAACCSSSSCFSCVLSGFKCFVSCQVNFFSLRVSRDGLVKFLLVFFFGLYRFYNASRVGTLCQRLRYCLHA